MLRQLQQGAAIALVSDAGTPAINDPGAGLVAAAAAAGLPVIPVPGASAVLAAVVAAGLPTHQFLFAGFTAPKSGARQKQFARLAALEATLVFYVSPHSLLAALQDAAAVFGADRRCAAGGWLAGGQDLQGGGCSCWGVFPQATCTLQLMAAAPIWPSPPLQLLPGPGADQAA